MWLSTTVCRAKYAVPRFRLLRSLSHAAVTCERVPIVSRNKVNGNSRCELETVISSRRLFSSDSGQGQGGVGSQEEKIIAVLRTSFPSASDIAVVDVSGGCGAMFEVYVEAPDFRGLRLVKQHQLVTKALKKEIGDMHGIRISTEPSPC